jgi:hypothetical protein
VFTKNTARETYARLQTFGPDGASVAAIGLADLELYQGHAKEAVAILEQAAAADLAQKNPDAAANKMVVLAQALLESGQVGAASAAADKAVSLSKDTGVRFWAPRPVRSWRTPAAGFPAASGKVGEFPAPL